MRSLAEGYLMLPQMDSPVSIPICELGVLGRRGFLHRDINGLNIDGSPRGPFDLEPTSKIPEYPILWGHHSKREQRLIVTPDRQGIPISGLQKEAVKIWRQGASRLHFSLGFQINSQPLAACMTEEISLGGPAWPNFMTRNEWEIPIVLWANTTLGLISSWWTGTRQQMGRSILTITLLPRLLTVNTQSLSNEQLDLCEKMFSDFRGQQFLPANQAYQDEVRIALDKAVLVNLIGLPDHCLNNLATLRKQWCAEPSVHRGKSTKPNEQE